MFAIFEENRVTRPLYRSTRVGRARSPRTKAGIPRETLWRAYPRRLSDFLRAVGARLREWRRRRDGRLELSRLDERMLRDIGLTRADADYEISKPFWRE
jgi:uncharacterized protein YjiS (DUF1127 family)